MSRYERTDKRIDNSESFGLIRLCRETKNSNIRKGGELKNQILGWGKRGETQFPQNHRGEPTPFHTMIKGKVFVR